MRKTRGNKKKDRKMRILAFFLCFAMLIGSLGNFFSISVLAASDDDVIVTESEQVYTETESESFVSTEVLSETEPAVVSSEEEIVESECSVDFVPAETEELPSAETESDTESTPSSEDFSDGSSEVLTEAITEFASESESETETTATEQTEHVSESKGLESEIVESIPMESETEPMPEVLSDGLDDTPMAKPEFTSQATVDGVEIRIHAPEGVLPEGVTVQVKPLADNVLDQASNSILEWVANETLVQLIGFDICFFDSDGEALHQFDQNIEVTYSGWNDVEKANAMQVFHAESSGNITESLTEPLEISDQVTFFSNAFSPILLAMYGAEEDEGISDLNTEIPENPVQVTFVIQDSVYTKDPGSGNTHLTVSEPMEDGDLSYTAWAGRYKVTGTGTMTQYTIPADTSLLANGLTVPSITVTNIGSNNTYTYGSVQSWVTEDGMICSADTVFYEDTVLYLSLYSSGEDYHFDYVCCPEENMSMSYYFGRNVTAKLGQSVASDFIPSYEDVIQSGFVSTTHDMTKFSGWKLKVMSTGAFVDLKPGMALTEDYLDPQYGNAIKVYASWEEEVPNPDESEDVYHQVMIHDVQPNGSEAGQVLDLSVGHGTTLSDALLDADTVLNDGTELTNCIWYTIGTNGEKTVVDLSSVVAADMELYTYTYDADFSVGDTVIFHTSVREGFPLSASDFVFNGVDYGVCRWTTEDGDVIDVAHLIQNGLTENITAVSTGILATAGLFRYAGHMVNFYVFVDEERVLLDARRVTSYYYNSRYYLSAGTLESVYGDCGFTAQQLTPGTHYFPHVDAGGATIWADTSVLEWGGFCYSPINNNTGTVDVYYLPNQSVTNTGLYWDYLTIESFYSVTVEDAMHQVYEADELPDPVYTRFGGTATVAVRNGEHVVWQCVGQDGVPIEGEEQDDGTTVFTIPDIAQPYVISPARQDGETFLTYDIHLPEYPSDEEYGTPEIEGGSTYSVLETSETHVVLAPSLTSYFYDSKKYLGEATFLGWVVNGNENQVVQPGDRLDLTLYDGDVTLRGSWSTKLGGISDSTGSMINFFVSLDALPEGTVSWTGHTETANFTFSVYTVDCGVNADTAVQQGLYDNISGGQYFVLGGTSGTDLNENHQTITNRLTDGYTLEGNDGASYTYRADFPTDEEVLLKVRQMVSNGTSIIINGHRITEDELTTTNFTIKWYVFKYDDSDGWHIDGILVTKTGEMVVTKTFAGDPEAISNVKEQYSIRVNGEAGATHDGATLTLADAVQVDDQTFSWTVDVDQYFDYVVTENEYLSEDPLITTMAQYNVRNSDVESQNTHGWVDYDTGVMVTGCGYSPGVSERQTVSFLNTYTAPGTLVLRKVDAGTGNLMSGVTFLISKDGNENFGVYSIGNGRYTADPAGQSGEKVTEIVTDSSGQAYLYVGGGIYRFTEIVPDGYDDPGTIVAELEGDPENAYKIVTITNVSADGGDSFVASNGLTLTVNNQSRMIDLHVEKIWADGENKPVTVQLYRSGVSMGNAYRVTFDGVLDDIETVPWSCVFSNLPLYSDGGLAEYSIREVVLGDFRYSSEYSDGYQYYDVRYSGMSYLDDTGSVTDVMADVRTISLNVTNRRTIGELVIDKVNEDGDPLSGAVFALYSMEDGEIPTREELEQQTPVKTVTSDADGHVSFGRVNAGEYYVIELSAPDGYVKSEQIYRVVFDGSDVFLYEYQDDGWERISENRIVNQRDTVRLTIEKQVTGDLGDRNKAFSFTYRYRNGTSFVTGTFSLKDDETYVLENIPAGTELSLTETNADEYEISGVYGVDGTVQTATDGKLTFVVRAEDQKIVITNRLEAIPDTGVTLDVVPYVILLSVIALYAMSFRFHQKDREE